ncbi:MAG: M28 family peptidase [Cyclobacteriaceae bacterium]|nr:M28 family peptidase [Cyclobacteriaceae bacterium]
MRNKIVALLFLILILTLSVCNNKKPEKEEKSVLTEKKSIIVPVFMADSAYHYIREQVDFGPRVPNTPPHLYCGNYLIEKFRNYAAEVQVQDFQQTAYNGEMLNLRNIIASFNPDNSRRILLAAHWDTRPVADKDSIRTDVPIDGANDGASGVGVLMEIARVISMYPLENIGVDIILFDGEDYGEPESYPGQATPEPGNTWWCLGSQYWSVNKHKPRYMAYYGILLDMVGAENAEFHMEGVSMMYAEKVVEKVWSTAAQLGYREFFIPQRSPEITDDHVFINRDARIPTINIVDYDPFNQNSYFPSYHHTHADNISIIDKNTLKAVGQTLLQVLYHE